MKKLNLALAFALGLIIPSLVMASDEVTIRVMEMHEKTTAEVMHRLKLPDFAVDKVAEDSLKYRHQLHKGSGPGNDGTGDQGQGSGTGSDNEQGTGDLDRDRIQDQDQLQVHDENQDRLMDQDRTNQDFTREPEHELESEPVIEQQIEVETDPEGPGQNGEAPAEPQQGPG